MSAVAVVALNKVTTKSVTLAIGSAKDQRIHHLEMPVLQGLSTDPVVEMVHFLEQIQLRGEKVDHQMEVPDLREENSSSGHTSIAHPLLPNKTHNGVQG